MAIDFEGTYRTQDEKFVAWSKGVSQESFDVRFVIEKLRDGPQTGVRRILDVGGGVGTVANAIVDSVEGVQVDVIDLSPLARDTFLGGENTTFILDNFLTRDFAHSYDVIIMRTLLHHLVGDSERETVALQQQALDKACELLVDDGRIFVTENFYEPLVFDDLTGRLIFEVTKLGSVEGVVRRLGANTAGVGVRFRSWSSWERIFSRSGLSALASSRSDRWGRSTPWWQQLPILCRHRFQSVVMLARAAPSR